jgi:hypothetical protein
MAATPSVRVVKSSVFKGGTRLWSNRYHFNGGTPADATHWHTLMDAIVAAEHIALSAECTITECVGYAAGSDVPVATKNYSTVGTVAQTGGSYHAAGEVAALVRWSTNARTVKNHPIYLFAYIHKPWIEPTAPLGDVLGGPQKTALGTYAAAWITGFSDGTNTYVRASPQGAAATGQFVEEYVTHRDFPYTPSL